MLKNEELALKKGMNCLIDNLGVVEIEMFISALTKSAYDYTAWRREYFENAYKSPEASQLENFLFVAAKNDNRGKTFGLES